MSPTKKDLNLREAEKYPKIYLYRRIVQSKLFIDENYAKRIELDDMSDEAYFSKFHFIRLFKKIYGMTPHQYLRVLRIQRAMQLLQAGTSVTDTCFSVGFESVTSFSGLFSSIVGQSPSTYLQQQLSIRLEILKTPLKFVPGCFASKSGWWKKSHFEDAQG